MFPAACRSPFEPVGVARVRIAAQHPRRLPLVRACELPQRARAADHAVSTGDVTGVSHGGLGTHTTRRGNQEVELGRAARTCELPRAGGERIAQWYDDGC